MLFAFTALASFEQYFIFFDGMTAIDCIDGKVLIITCNSCNSAYSRCLNFFNISFAAARYADNINIVTENAVFLDKLVKAVCIAGFEEHSNFSLFFGFLYQIFGKIVPAEIVVNKSLFEFFCAPEHGRCNIVNKCTGLPSKNTIDCAVL